MKVSTWTEHATTTDGAAATATHDGVADKTHFVSGLAYSVASDGMGSVRYADIELKDEDDNTLIKIRTMGSAEYQTAGPGGSEVINFSAPIQIPEGKDVVAEIDAGGATVVHVNIWGFTDSARQS